MALIWTKACEHVYAAWEANPNHSQALTQVAPDIWIAERSIPTHTDFPKPNFVSFGLVILNELNLSLLYKDRNLSLRVGDSYRIDSSLPHSALNLSRREYPGLFCALIWDVPETLAPWDLHTQALARIEEWLSQPIVTYA